MSRRTPAEEIKLYGTLLGLSELECDDMASGGTYGARVRCARDLRRRYRRQGANQAQLDGVAQFEFWQQSAPVERFVYWVQEGDSGPVKIGVANDPLDRMATLQTGNPTELFLRYVVPGDPRLERQLHHRFREARVRGEWFGDDPDHDLAYLRLILLYADGLAAEHIECFEADRSVPTLIGNRVMSKAGYADMCRDLTRLLDRYDYFPDEFGRPPGYHEVNRIMEASYGLNEDEVKQLVSKVGRPYRQRYGPIARRGGKKLGHRMRPARQATPRRTRVGPNPR